MNIAQVDIEGAFHRIASPLGWSELMVLLPLRWAFLVANYPDVDVSHVSSRLVSTRFIVPLHGVELEPLLLPTRGGSGHSQVRVLKLPLW